MLFVACESVRTSDFRVCVCLRTYMYACLCVCACVHAAGMRACVHQTSAHVCVRALPSLCVCADCRYDTMRTSDCAHACVVCSCARVAGMRACARQTSC